MTLQELYVNPYVRVTRRFLVAGIAATAAVLATKLTFSPASIIPSIVALSRADWLSALNVGAGTALLLALDKIRSEWGALTTYGKTSTDPLA